MGKKTKKTRWRTLTLNGHQSDSEESNTPSSQSHQNNRNYHSRYYNSKFTYSSQSTPIRKYQNDSSKTTRSNSTTSEHKTTFNEDEYTRITTPRQDVLFKKGYLNKPKTYQTQTSTGTSSTANSTSTCTPDHQSADGTEGTDLEYESQFVFPNGFIDHNGIYYINSYEPFQFVVYNAPICYPEYTAERTKRYSTDSGGDSVSPHNEEVIQNGVSQPIDYYYNNATASDHSNEEPRRPKKKRRRKISRTKEEDDNSCDTDSSEAVFPETESVQTEPILNGLHQNTQSNINEDDKDQEPKLGENDSQTLLLDGLTKQVEDDNCNKNKALKPDAQEFIPRTVQVPPEIPYEHNNIQYVNFAPSYISVPYLNHNPTFLPPGIPINYVPIPEPKFVNVIVPNSPETKEPPQLEKVPEVATQTDPQPLSEQNSPKKGSIDIAKIVLKLEEAVVEQNKSESIRERQPFTQNKKGRFYQKNIRAKPVEKPKMQTPPSLNKPNNYSATLKKNAQVVNKQCERYAKTLEKPVIKQHSVNQWISVSSRKKKRKGVSEQQDDIQDVPKEEDQNEDLFESFDVNLLEDVVPTSKKIADEVANTNEDCNTIETDTKQVDTVETEHITVEPVAVELESKLNGEMLNDTTETELVVAHNNEKAEAPFTKTKEKKKTKRTLPKLLVKRIIITDDLQQSNNDLENKEPLLPTPEIKPKEVEPVSKVEVKPSENDTATETLEKKKKKKKKVAKLQSSSSSTTTLSNLDDSYDFFLETSIMEDCHQKTNIEMSHAFDLMIQKGMFNSLEEKIKALKISASEDGFFKTINFSTFKTPPTPSKQIFASPQFDKLFQKDFLTSKQDLKASNSAIFLENPTVNEIIKNAVEPNHEVKQHKDNYPITQAVKNWLTKTRENTPDVELLKSPNTIYKELSAEPNDEVTLWSVSTETSAEGDLLDCWENEMSPGETETSQRTRINGYHNGNVEEGEDAIEIYESKYGKNEDYLKLKAEVEEQQRSARNFPRHGNLPYRAICCNIM